MTTNTKQKLIEGVPDWFDLKLYGEDRSMEEWFCQIFARLQFYDPDEGRFLRVDRQTISKLIPAWLQGIFEDDEPRDLFRHLNARNSELQNLRTLINERKRNTPPFSLPKYVESPTNAGIVTLHFSMEKNPNKTLIEVDFNRREKELVSQFRNLIKAHRKAFPLPKKQKLDPKSMIENWQKYKLLPAFDLLLWREQCEKRKKSPSKIDIVATLFREKMGTFEHGQHMKKVIEPAIKKMMQPESLEALSELSDKQG